MTRIFVALLACVPFLCLSSMTALGGTPPPEYERMAEWSFDSGKRYADPLSVEVDVIFERAGQNWRVPAFWSGESRWTVRFAPATPGEYAYRLESSDRANHALNGHDGRISITAYTGSNPLLKHGMPRVSASGRYFEQADGTPFFWMGESWWTGLSDRLPWEGFQTLTKDRVGKGFTVVQICAGLIVSNEEKAPSDSGFCNEGGCAWSQGFKEINPKYFDYADRRIQYLIDSGIAPAIVGAWSQALGEMGVDKLKQHWRYLVARYGAYPVFWIAGGEVYDPAPQSASHRLDEALESLRSPGWSEIVRYIRSIDPYHHPLSVHERTDDSLQDNSLTDFEVAQAGSVFGPATLGYEVAMLNMRYARVSVRKPVVMGEVAIEQLGNSYFEDFQRGAFWLGMLNGAAGVTYTAAPVFEANNPAKPLHRFAQFTFLSWEEGMNFPGSYEMGIGSKLLRRYPWWQFAPHPEWVTPRGTTLLEPNTESYGLNVRKLGGFTALLEAVGEGEDYYWTFWRTPEAFFPGGVWQQKRGNFRAPYAAGVPGQVRVIYAPYVGLSVPPPPTVLQLEPGIRYHAYLWEPSLGIPFDLGVVERPKFGPVIFEDALDLTKPSHWTVRSDSSVGAKATVEIVKDLKQSDMQVSVDVRADSDATVLLRYRDPDNYLAVTYSAGQHLLALVPRRQGKTGSMLGSTQVASTNAVLNLSAEVRGNAAVAEVNDGQHTFSTPIEDLQSDRKAVGLAVVTSGDGARALAGTVGFAYTGGIQPFRHFVVRTSPELPSDTALQRTLIDARGRHRGELSGPGWDDFGRTKLLLLDAYRPERFPSAQDWVLVLETVTGHPEQDPVHGPATIGDSRRSTRR